MMLAFIMIPLLQKELDDFKDIVWNNHRIRSQDTYRPDGIPNHMYPFPVKYNLQNCGKMSILNYLEGTNFRGYLFSRIDSKSARSISLKICTLKV